MTCISLVIQGLMFCRDYLRIYVCMYAPTTARHIHMYVYVHYSCIYITIYTFMQATRFFCRANVAQVPGCYCVSTCDWFSGEQDKTCRRKREAILGVPFGSLRLELHFLKQTDHSSPKQRSWKPTSRPVLALTRDTGKDEHEILEEAP
jgi:hypothetical protein